MGSVWLQEFLKAFLLRRERFGGRARDSVPQGGVPVLHSAREMAAASPSRSQRTCAVGTSGGRGRNSRGSASSEQSTPSLKEEKAGVDRRRPLIKSFYSWLQAFSIYASVPCEKFPSRSCLLFQHIDIILKAYRSFNGMSWLMYDEAFHQKLAVQPSLQWGSKDVGPWLILFLPQRQPFSRPAALAAPPNSATTNHKKGLCFAFNDSQCKWMNACKYRH